MQITGIVGPQILQDGANPTFRAGKAGELNVSELQGRYYENTYRGSKFSATFPAAASAALGTSALNVIINQTGSGKNLVFIDALVSLTAYTAQTLAGSSIVIASFAAATLPTTVGSVITPASCLIGSSNASQAKLWASATVGVAPVTVRQLAGWCLGTATPGADVVSAIHDEIAGQLILTPGYGIAIMGLGGTPADLTIQTTLTWDEVAI